MLEIVRSDFYFFCFSLLSVFIFFFSRFFKQKLADRFAWQMFSLFALVQATSHLFELIQQFYNLFPSLESARPVFSFLSSLLIGAFALNISNKLGEKHNKRHFWFVPVILVFATLSFGLRIFTFLQALIVGLPAIILTIKAFYEENVFKAGTTCLCQKISGIALSAFLTINLLQDIRFIPTESFFVSSLLLTSFAFLAAAFWCCARVIDQGDASSEIIRSSKYLKLFAPVSLAIIFPVLFLLTLILVGSSFYYEKNAKITLGNSLKLLFESHWHPVDVAARKLSSLPEIKKIFQSPDDSQTLKKVNKLIDDHSLLIKNSVVYLMDKDGNTISSSNRNSKNSFLNQNFAFRPYFKQAIEGKPADYLARGIISNRFGYYSAQPVHSANGKVLGVVVIKSDLRNIKKELPGMPAIALIDENSELVIANRPTDFWVNFLPLNNVGFIPANISGNHEYDGVLSFYPSEDDFRAPREQRNLFVWRYKLNISGWALCLVDNAYGLAWVRLLGLTIAFLAAFVLVVVAYIWDMSLKTAQEVEKNARIYESLVEGSSNIVALMDIYGNFLTLNTMGRRTLGLEKDDELGSLRLPDIWDKESVSSVRESLQKCLNGKKVVCEAVKTEENGPTYWELLLNPVTKNNTLPREIIGIFHNFTQRKLATLELRKEKDLVDNLLNTAQAIILLLDSKANILQVNQYFYDITGYTEEEVLGKSWLDNFVAEDDKLKVSSFFQRYSRSSGVAPLLNKIVTSDGKTLDIEWRNKTLRDENRKAMGIIAVGQDVTRHLQIENTLRESKSKFAMLNNCFIRFGNSPEDNMEMLGEIAWMLTGADSIVIKEFKDNKFQSLNISTVNEEEVENLKTAFSFDQSIEKLGKSPAVLNDLQHNKLIADPPEGIKGAIANLIYFNNQLTGAIFACFSSEVEEMSAEDLNLVSIVAQAIGVEIIRMREDRQLREAFHQLALKDKRMSLEMEIARTVHRSFLAEKAPECSPYKIGQMFQPCFSVGGDYFEFIPFAEKQQLGVLFADISGHGVAGALLSSMLKALIKETTSENNDPNKVLLKMNDSIESNFPEGYFVSAFFALIDKKDENIIVASAAPEPAILLRKDKRIEKIAKGGQPMGLLPTEFVDPDDFASFNVKLHPGDTLLFFTDGITDIKISEDERIGLDRFCQWVSELAGAEPQDLCDNLYSRATEAAIEKGIDDDIMLLAIKR